MRSVAWGLLGAVLLSIIILPLVDLANVLREKILIGSALTNASRAAEYRSVQYEQHRDLNAVLDEERFIDVFAESFEDALNLTTASVSGTTIRFTSDDGKFNDIAVTLDFETRTASEGRLETEVRMEARTDYKFKTNYLQLAEDAAGVNYEMLSERMLLVQIRN